MRVAFYGMGRMGRPMAANLVAAGHEVFAWNRTPGKAPPGARECGSVREAASGAEVAITMLADDVAVETVARDLFGALGSGAVHCGMSTISVQLSRRLAQEHAQRGGAQHAAYAAHGDREGDANEHEIQRWPQHAPARALHSPLQPPRQHGHALLRHRLGR